MAICCFFIDIKKKDLSNAFKRITSLETSIAKMEFREELCEIEIKSIKDNIEQTKESDSWLLEILEIAEINPRDAIMEAWSAIEITCVGLLE